MFCFFYEISISMESVEGLNASIDVPTLKWKKEEKNIYFFHRTKQ